mgnify:CR=1 FL=1|jgi:PAS domain S-box-containing protein
MSKDVWLLENALMQSALQASGIGLIILDSSGRIVSVNDMVCRGLKVGRLDLLGQPFQLLLRPELNLPRFREVFHVDSPALSTKARLDTDGLVHVLLISATTCEVSGGERFRAVSVVDAMSFGVSYDQAAATRHHMQAMNTCTVLIDTTRPEYPLLQVNATFERIFGRKARDVIGTPLFELIRQPGNAVPVQKDMETQIAESIVQGRTMRQVLNIYSKDGRVMQVDWRQTPLVDAHGVTTQVVAALRPMTELLEHAGKMPAAVDGSSAELGL